MEEVGGLSKRNLLLVTITRNSSSSRRSGSRCRSTCRSSGSTNANISRVNGRRGSSKDEVY